MIFLGLVSLYVFAVSLTPLCVRTKSNNSESEFDSDSDDEKRCCICDDVLRTRGHNPFPFCDEDDTETKCCNSCKHSHVIPARLSIQRRQDLSEKHQETILKCEINKILEARYNDLGKEHSSQ